MHDKNRSSRIPTALICVLLLLVLMLGGGVVGVMYVQSQQLQATNQNFTAAMAAQQAKVAKLEQQKAELEAVNDELQAQQASLNAVNQQLRDQNDALKAAIE